MEIGEGRNMFFNKSGDAVFGRVVPTAYVTNNPWPPGSTNVNKNTVYRPSYEESTEMLQESQAHFDREAQHASHFYIVPPKGKENDENNRLPTRRRIPEIEMAIYWDRTPYRQRLLHPVNSNSLLSSKERSKSAANVSSLKELLTDTKSVDMSEDSVKKNSLRTESHKEKEIHEKGCPAAVTSQSPEISSEPAMVNEGISLPLQHPSNSKNASNSEYQEDKGSLKEIKSEHKSQRQSSSSSLSSSITGKETDIVKELVKQARRSNRVKSVSDIKSASFEEDVNPETQGVRAVGVQVTSDKVSLAALKSIYLCPLHGQYNKKEKERLEKANFKESLSTAVHPDNMKCGRCSSHHTRHRARSVSSRRVTSGEKEKDQKNSTVGDTQSEKGQMSANKIKAPRSKTAKSEYAGNFQHPKQLSTVYNRQLRNKILSYCFTKQSIF